VVTPQPVSDMVCEWYVYWYCVVCVVCATCAALSYVCLCFLLSLLAIHLRTWP
jgi:hypothetical protein